MSKKLQDKVALVTGSGRGIGRAIALKMADEGARVVVNDLDEAPALEVVAEIKAAGGDAIAYPGSVTADGFAEGFVKSAIDKWGRLDIIINNAGYTWDNVIQKMTDQQWDAIVDCHMKAPFQILRAAHPYLREASKAEAERGEEVFRKVVNISSIGGTQGNVGQSNYSAAKAGLIGLSKTLAKEWARMKVNVNCVAYAAIETRLTEGVNEKKTIVVEGNAVPIGVPMELKSQAAALIPMGRMGTVEEAAGSVYMFCIPESNYVTGQTIICGGGRGGF